MTFTESEVKRMAGEFESKTAEDLLRWVFDTFGSKAMLASSFGAEDVALIDMAVRIFPGVRIVTLDTGRLPEETYETIDAVRRKYRVNVEPFFPDAAKVEELLRAKGAYSFRESVENRLECCRIRKVGPLRRALGGSDAWITGVRRLQGATRSDAVKLEIDVPNGGFLKVSPLVDWSEEKVWEYIRARGVPYNRLHDAGYRSIGCAPCTRAVKPGEDVRAGRWWWESPDHKECGLHEKHEKSAVRERKQGA